VLAEVAVVEAEKVPAGHATHTPEALAHLLDRATAPVVSGTTGAPPPIRADRALLHSANFSLGVAVLAHAVRDVAARLPGWDLEIVEIHHRAKRDAPSGTALRLAAAAGRGAPHNGHDGPRVAGAVGAHAVRGGDVVGEHTVYLFGHGERVTLGHVATDRAIFARGALVCARWMVGRAPGLYSLDDVVAAPA
jgi:4-hydroxy-tetrahydrodipicolinate reductase